MPKLPAEELKLFRITVAHYRYRNSDWLKAINKHLPLREEWTQNQANALEYIEKDGRPRKPFTADTLRQLETAFGHLPEWPEWRERFVAAIDYQDSLHPAVVALNEAEGQQEENRDGEVDTGTEEEIIEEGEGQSEESEATMTFQTDQEEPRMPDMERRNWLPFIVIALALGLGGSCVTGAWLQRTLSKSPGPLAVLPGDTREPTEEAVPTTAVATTTVPKATTAVPAPTATVPTVTPSSTPTATDTATATSTATATPTKTPTVTPTPFPLPFEDDFSAGLTDSWRTVSGKWGWADGRLEARESPGWAIILTGDPNWTDYAVEVNIGANYRWTDTRIVLRAVGENYMAFNLSTHNGPWNAFALMKVENGKTTEIARGGGYLDVEIGGHSYRAEAVGDFYRLYQDGYLAFETQDDSFTQGAVGLGISGHLEDAWFDNFKVTAR
jgi:hypothetical protein